MFLILFRLVSWWTFFPAVSDCLSSLIEFDVFLNSKVSTSISVFQPVDALSLDDETNYDAEEGGIIVIMITCIWSHILVNTDEEHPEREIINLLNFSWICLLHAYWVQK